MGKPEKTNLLPCDATKAGKSRSSSTIKFVPCIKHESETQGNEESSMHSLHSAERKLRRNDLWVTFTYIIADITVKDKDICIYWRGFFFKSVLLIGQQMVKQTCTGEEQQIATEAKSSGTWEWVIHATCLPTWLVTMGRKPIHFECVETPTLTFLFIVFIKKQKRKNSCFSL